MCSVFVSVKHREINNLYLFLYGVNISCFRWMIPDAKRHSNQTKLNVKELCKKT